MNTFSGSDERCTTVEFFGLPGVGKSWWAGKMSCEKNVPLITISNRREKYWLALRFAMTQPSAFLFFMRVAWRESRDNRALRSHKIRHIFFNGIAREQKALRAPGKALLDEGLCQFLLSLFERRVEKKEVAACLCYLPKSRCVYIVEAPGPVREQRFRERGRKPRSFLGEAYVASWELVLKHNYPVIKNVLMEHYPTVLIGND